MPTAQATLQMFFLEVQFFLSNNVFDAILVSILRGRRFNVDLDDSVSLYLSLINLAIRLYAILSKQTMLIQLCSIVSVW